MNMQEATHVLTLDIEVHDCGDRSWAQARYLVHGYRDVFWTDSVEDALSFIKQSLLEYEGKPEK